MRFGLVSPSLPLHVDADGVIRVAHTRVTLELGDVLPQG